MFTFIYSHKLCNSFLGVSTGGYQLIRRKGKVTMADQPLFFQCSVPYNSCFDMFCFIGDILTLSESLRRMILFKVFENKGHILTYLSIRPRR